MASQIWNPYIDSEQPMDLSNRGSTFVQTPPTSAGSSTGSSALGVSPPYDEVLVTRNCNCPPVLPSATRYHPSISPESAESCTHITSSVTEGDLSQDIEYQIFERDAMIAMATKNGGNLLGENPRMRRSVQSQQGADDDNYRRQRQRNNIAAKQSRDRRKLREVRLALQVAYLQKKVVDLNTKLAANVCSRCHLYTV